MSWIQAFNQPYPGALQYLQAGGMLPTRQQNSCYPGLAQAVGLAPGVYGQPAAGTVVANYGSPRPRLPGARWRRASNFQGGVGAIGPALGLSPLVYGVPFPGYPSLGEQQKIGVSPAEAEQWKQVYAAQMRDRGVVANPGPRDCETTYNERGVRTTCCWTGPNERVCETSDDRLDAELAAQGWTRREIRLSNPPGCSFDEASCPPGWEHDAREEDPKGKGDCWTEHRGEWISIPAYCEKRPHTRPLAVAPRPRRARRRRNGCAQESPWMPTAGYGTGQYGSQYGPNANPAPCRDLDTGDVVDCAGAPEGSCINNRGCISVAVDCATGRPLRLPMECPEGWIELHDTAGDVTGCVPADTGCRRVPTSVSDKCPPGTHLHGYHGSDDGEDLERVCCPYPLPPGVELNQGSPAPYGDQASARRRARMARSGMRRERSTHCDYFPKDKWGPAQICCGKGDIYEDGDCLDLVMPGPAVARLSRAARSSNPSVRRRRRRAKVRASSVPGMGDARLVAKAAASDKACDVLVPHEDGLLCCWKHPHGIDFGCYLIAPKKPPGTIPNPGRGRLRNPSTIVGDCHDSGGSLSLSGGMLCCKVGKTYWCDQVAPPKPPGLPTPGLRPSRLRAPKKMGRLGRRMRARRANLIESIAQIPEPWTIPSAGGGA